MKWLPLHGILQQVVRIRLRVVINDIHITPALIHVIGRGVVQQVATGIPDVRGQLPIVAQAELPHRNTAEEHPLYAIGVGVSVTVRVEGVVCKIYSLPVDHRILAAEAAVETLGADLGDDIRS